MSTIKTITIVNNGVSSDEIKEKVIEDYKANKSIFFACKKYVELANDGRMYADDTINVRKILVDAGLIHPFI